MLSKDKKDKFRQIAEQLITQEYLGAAEYGKDADYERELTTAASEYLYSIFNAPSESDRAKENLVVVMSRREIKHPSNILRIIL
jgi:hypothetical protein